MSSLLAEASGWPDDRTLIYNSFIIHDPFTDLTRKIASRPPFILAVVPDLATSAAMGVKSKSGNRCNDKARPLRL